jgi:hypothetical protein
VCQRELEGTQYKLTTEMAQKSRDSMLLIGARVQGGPKSGALWNGQTSGHFSHFRFRFVWKIFEAFLHAGGGEMGLIQWQAPYRSVAVSQ